MKMPEKSLGGLAKRQESRVRGASAPGLRRLRRSTG